MTRPLLAVVVVALCALAAAPSAGAATGRSCGWISFQANSENGIANIRAVGVSCARARRVARAVEPLSVTRGPYRYRNRGFACRGALQRAGAPIVHWRCTRGRATIRFLRGA